MSPNTLSIKRVRQLIEAAQDRRILVLGDVMLDQFIWGYVGRISPEAPVPVVEFERESFMPGGAANVARNLNAFTVKTQLCGVVGHDSAGRELKKLLTIHRVGFEGVVAETNRNTSIKTRIIAHQQQVVRLDRESRAPLAPQTLKRLLSGVVQQLDSVDAVIIGDYGKGVVSQELLDEVRSQCRSRGIWLSLDPKPVHHLSLTGLSLITPNRKEAFDLAGMADGTRKSHPLQDEALLGVAQNLLGRLHPAMLLITLGDQGMLLCARGKPPFHIPTVAQEVYDVSGAGDTVIASFTLAIAAGASPIEAAIISNHAAGVVVGKIGTAMVSPEELIASFSRRR